MLTIDDVQALTNLRDSFNTTSEDYQMADSLVQDPNSLSNPVRQGQLADVMASLDPNSPVVKSANVVLAYWEAQS